MGLSKLSNIAKIVPFTIEGVNVDGQGTYTKNIDIGESFWEIAQVTFWLRNISSIYADARRISSYITLTTNYDDAFSQMSSYKITSVPSYPSGMLYYLPNYKYSGFSFATDARLSDYSVDRDARYIRVNKGRINGSNVEIEFYNAFGSIRTLDLEGNIRLSRNILI